MASAVRADPGMVALAEPPARAEQRRAIHPGIGRDRYQPAQRHAAGAVHDGREARLAGGMQNPVTSVIHSSLGPSAWKWCLPRSSRSRFSGASVLMAI